MTNSPFYDAIYKYTAMGYRVSEISKALNNQLSRQRISVIRQQIIDDNPHFQIVYENRQARINHEILETIKIMVKCASVAEIADSLGISKSQVYKFIKENKIKREPDALKKDPIIDEGSMIGYWHVGKMVEKIIDGERVRYYECKCTCCNEITAIVRQSNLRSGLSKSCNRCRRGNK